MLSSNTNSVRTFSVCIRTAITLLRNSVGGRTTCYKQTDLKATFLGETLILETVYDYYASGASDEVTLRPSYVNQTDTYSGNNS